MCPGDLKICAVYHSLVVIPPSKVTLELAFKFWLLLFDGPCGPVAPVGPGAPIGP